MELLIGVSRRLNENNNQKFTFDQFPTIHCGGHGYSLQNRTRTEGGLGLGSLHVSLSLNEVSLTRWRHFVLCTCLPLPQVFEHGVHFITHLPNTKMINRRMCNVLKFVTWYIPWLCEKTYFASHGWVLHGSVSSGGPPHADASTGLRSSLTTHHRVRVLIPRKKNFNMVNVAIWYSIAWVLSWRLLKSWYTSGDLEQGFGRCFVDGINQKLIFVCGAGQVQDYIKVQYG